MNTELVDRYKRDAEFATLVDLMVKIGALHKFTGGDLRDASYVAALRIEAMVSRSYIAVPHEEV